MTVGEYLEQWGETLGVAGRKPSTVASYRRNLRVHVIPRLGGLRLQALTPLHLDTMYADLLADGNMRTEGDTLKPSNGPVRAHDPPQGAVRRHPQGLDRPQSVRRRHSAVGEGSEGAGDGVLDAR